MTGGLAKIAQLAELQTEDLKVPGSIQGFSIMHSWHLPSKIKLVGTRAVSRPGNGERQNAKKAWHMEVFKMLLKSRR